jgi:predicted nucleic-acid-binding protein
MRAVDTNVLVRLVVRDDSQQAQAAEKLGLREKLWVKVAHFLIKVPAAYK